MWVFLRTKFLCTILALYSNIAAETFYSDDDTSCVLQNVKLPLQMSGQLLFVWIHAAAQRGAPAWTCLRGSGSLHVPLPIPMHTNEALKQTQSPLLLYSGKCWECAWTWCIYPCHALVTSRCCHHWLAEPKSAQCKCGLLHFIGRWALLLSIIILISSSCSEFRLSPPLMSFVGNRCLQRCEIAYGFLREGFQKNLYCICRPSTSWGTLVIMCNQWGPIQRPHPFFTE